MAGYIVLALFLLSVGLVGLLYSSWAQDAARKTLTAKMSTPEATLTVGTFALRFPLSVEATDVALTSYGDTVMAARALDAEVSLLPLLAGKAEVSRLSLAGARYRLGAPDSAMCLTVAADSLGLAPVVVGLADMDIDLREGLLRGARLSINLNPDTATAKESSQPTRMTIRTGRIALVDFAYTMRLMPSIDTLTAHIDSAVIGEGTIAMLDQRIRLRDFTGRGLDARYIAPDSAAVVAAGPYPEASPDTSATAPWTVEIDSIAFDRSHALYTTAGVRPLPGLDFGYIEVSDLALRLTDFYNQATTVRLPLSLTGTERCGVRLNVAGELDIDSVALRFREVTLGTPAGTDVGFSGILGMGDMAADPSLPIGLSLTGDFAPADLRMMFPAFTPYLAAIPSADDIRLLADVSGTTGSLDIDKLALRLNGCVDLNATGRIDNMMQPDRLGGDIALTGRIMNVDGFKRSLLAPETAAMLRIPPMTLRGRVAMASGTVDGRLRAVTSGGDIGLDARWNSRAESYTATVDTRTFPVQAFMPLLELENVTATAKVDGRGYDVFSPRTRLDADVAVAAATYRGNLLRDITAKASLADGQATVDIESDNPAADLGIKASGNLAGDTYAWTATVDGRYVDLYALKLSAEPASLELTLDGDATIGPGKNDISGRVHLSDLFFRRNKGTIGIGDLTAHLDASDSLTTAGLNNRDLTASFSSPVSLDSLTRAFSAMGAIAAEQMKVYSIEADTLFGVLPRFALDVRGGRSNLVNDILAPDKMSLRSFAISADKDSTVALDGYVRGFDTGSMRLDSIYINAGQHDDHLHLTAGVLNRPGNLDTWHAATVKARLDGNEAALRLSQSDIKGRTGYDLGIAATADAADSTFTFHIRPVDPIIAYQNWTANDDNFISYTVPTQHIDANLRMSGAGSSLAIFTEHPEGHDSHADDSQEDLVIRLSDIHISDWISMNPFAPPMKGDVTADMRLNRHDGRIVGQGTAGISNFVYGREKVADFKADFNVAATPSGTINADADVYVDGVKTMTLAGALNDSTATSPLDLDFAMIRFPLATVNPFMPAGTLRMAGMLNGQLKITGTSGRPVLNGSLTFDSTTVRPTIIGTAYAFSPVPIDVANSVVRFDRFTIKGCNDNPLYVDGTVDLTDMANARINLALKADNMMIVDSKRLSKGADIYGRGFISLNANAHGSMSFLQLNADLSLNSNTNLTYVIPDATSAITNRSTDDMVRFVNFADSAAVAQADTLTRSAMAMMLNAQLSIQDGSIINVDLSADGKNRVQLQSNGSLTYEMTPLNSGRLSGRVNIDKGFVRYTPPFMSEKLFNFTEGSYVAFNGNMMNPVLNVHAVDVVKANVTQSGRNSRLVDFDVSLAVTGTLNQMNVAFDLATNDDITVANELESMSADQRANQAMNLLLYNVYTGPGTKGNASLAGNPLFSFLEGQINSWAANNIKGVDLTFGIDQYDRTVNGSTASTMSYSYQVSKTLFNDRFKIVVGGNYSTDANADENFSQNLINDISFEYYLNDTRTMYVRLFRHTGYESILEGEITQTGVGFVYRRKLRRLGDMFLPASVVRRRTERQNEKESHQTPQP